MRGKQGSRKPGKLAIFRNDRAKYPNRRVSHTEIKRPNLKGACQGGRLELQGWVREGIWEFWWGS